MRTINNMGKKDKHFNKLVYDFANILMENTNELTPEQINQLHCVLGGLMVYTIEDNNFKNEND